MRQNPYYAQNQYNNILDFIKTKQKYLDSHIKGPLFWHLGEVFDSLIDHLIIHRQKDTKDLITQAFTFFDKANPTKDWTFWVDDYGWWGVLFMKAHDHAHALGYDDPELVKKLLTYAHNCHSRMLKEWDEKNGGIRNTAKSDTNSHRNAITNQLFVLLSSRLHLATAKTEYAQSARKTYEWMKSQSFYNAEGFVRELPQDESDQSNKEWLWSGDQGVNLGALSAYSEFEDKTELSKKIKDCADKLITTSVFVDPDGILHEANYVENFSENFAQDFGVGKGVLMRYLGQLNRQNPNRPYASFVQKNAKAYRARLEQGSAYPRNWNPAYAEYEKEITQPDELWQLVLLTVGLNALNAEF